MNDETRERLARRLATRSLPAMNLTEEAREGCIQRSLYHYRGEIDAILAELAAAGYELKRKDGAREKEQ